MSFLPIWASSWDPEKRDASFPLCGKASLWPTVLPPNKSFSTAAAASPWGRKRTQLTTWNLVSLWSGKASLWPTYSLFSMWSGKASLLPHLKPLLCVFRKASMRVFFARCSPLSVWSGKVSLLPTEASSLCLPERRVFFASCSLQKSKSVCDPSSE